MEVCSLDLILQGAARPFGFVVGERLFLSIR